MAINPLHSISNFFKLNKSNLQGKHQNPISQPQNPISQPQSDSIGEAPKTIGNDKLSLALSGMNGIHHSTTNVPLTTEIGETKQAQGPTAEINELTNETKKLKEEAKALFQEANAIAQRVPNEAIDKLKKVKEESPAIAQKLNKSAEEVIDLYKKSNSSERQKNAILIGDLLIEANGRKSLFKNGSLKAILETEGGDRSITYFRDGKASLYLKNIEQKESDKQNLISDFSYFLDQNATFEESYAWDPNGNLLSYGEGVKMTPSGDEADLCIAFVAGKPNFYAKNYKRLSDGYSKSDAISYFGPDEKVRFHCQGEEKFPDGSKKFDSQLIFDRLYNKFASYTKGGEFNSDCSYKWDSDLNISPASGQLDYYTKGYKQSSPFSYTQDMELTFKNNEVESCTKNFEMFDINHFTRGEELKFSNGEPCSYGKDLEYINRELAKVGTKLTLKDGKWQ